MKKREEENAIKHNFEFNGLINNVSTSSFNMNDSNHVNDNNNTNDMNHIKTISLSLDGNIIKNISEQSTQPDPAPILLTVNNNQNINDAFGIRRPSVEFEDIHNIQTGVPLPTYISNDDQSESSTFTASDNDQEDDNHKQDNEDNVDKES